MLSSPTLELIKKKLHNDGPKLPRKAPSRDYEVMRNPLSKDRAHTSYIEYPSHKRGKSVENSRIIKNNKTFNTELENSPREVKLKTKVKKLQKTVKKQNMALEDVYQKVLQGRNEIKSLTKHFFKDKEKEDIIQSLQDKIEAMHNQENKMLQELKAQKKVTEDLVNRMYLLQTESSAEIESAKQHYKEYYSRGLEKEVEHYKQKLCEFEREKEQLLFTIRDAEKNRDMEKSIQFSIDKEFSSIRTELEKERRENRSLKDEIKALKDYMKEKDRVRQKETETLNDCINQLRQENDTLKDIGDDRQRKDSQEKTQLKKHIRELEEELTRREKASMENEIEYRNELDKTRKRVFALEEENRKLGDYTRKIEEMKREINLREEEFIMKEKFYQEKLEMSKRAQEQRKEEWSNVYNELLQEVRELKAGMGFLENENQRLITSIDSKSFEHTYLHT